jgi:hypothetical protein
MSIAPSTFDRSPQELRQSAQIKIKIHIALNQKMAVTAAKLKCARGSTQRSVGVLARQANAA